jgi:hypothetical protein
MRSTEAARLAGKYAPAAAATVMTQQDRARMLYLRTILDDGVMKKLLPATPLEIRGIGLKRNRVNRFQGDI